MKKTFILLAILILAIASCTKERNVLSSNIKCEVSAKMPEFRDGGGIDTKATIQSVVKINWAAGDKLVVINLTSGKQLGGCLVADKSASETTFTPQNLNGTISAGDKLILYLDTKNDLAVENEKTYEPFDVNLSEQNGGSDNVPIVAYAEYTASKAGEIIATNLDFHFMVSYIQLALSALPAGTQITAFEVNNVNSSCKFKIQDNAFVMEKTKGKVKLIDAFSANSKGANVRYFSIFASGAEVSAREATITANGQDHTTTWVKAGMDAGSYYQSVATGFANENIQFIDPAFKAHCVAHYDKNGDGEVSFAEAAAVTAYVDFSTSEKSSIVSVYELAYFPSKLGLPKFEGCTALKNIAIPGTVTAIPVDEFKGCTSLGEINIPDNVTSIGAGAFEGCTSLQYFSGNLASDDNRFLSSSDTLFAYAPYSYEFVTIPNDIHVIGEGVFKNSTNLKSIQLSNVNSIENQAFLGCVNLTKLNLPHGINNIKSEAFKGCSNLSTVYAQKAEPSEIGTNVFQNCSSDLKIFVSQSSEAAYKSSAWNAYDIRARVWNQIFYTTSDGKAIEFFHEWSKYACDRGGQPTNNLLSNEYDENGGVLTFSGDVFALWEEWIDEPDPNTGRGATSMFTGQTRLTSITLPDCVFQFPNLRGCSNLETIYVPESITHSSMIWRYGLEELPKLASFTGNNVSNDGMCIILEGYLDAMVSVFPNEEYSIPTTVKSINHGPCLNDVQAESCNLSTIIIGDNVKDFSGLYSFRGCRPTTIKLTSSTPPVIPDYYTPFWLKANGQILVPNIAVDVYKTAGLEWSQYSDKINGY